LFDIGPHTWEILQERFKCKNSMELRDIYDGEGYKRHISYLSNPAHVSLLLNTDGVALYRSSKVSIWPVWAVINELPPSKRYAFIF
jgi:hypothetical protein